jgi:hypothetical protein
MWHIDLNDWEMADMKRWSIAQRSGDIAMMNTCLSEAIVAWPYDPDPTDEFSYDELTTDEWNLAVLQLEAAIQNRLQIGDASVYFWD